MWFTSSTGSFLRHVDILDLVHFFDRSFLRQGHFIDRSFHRQGHFFDRDTSSTVLLARASQAEPVALTPNTCVTVIMIWSKKWPCRWKNLSMKWPDILSKKWPCRRNDPLPCQIYSKYMFFLWHITTGAPCNKNYEDLLFLLLAWLSS